MPDHGLFSVLAHAHQVSRIASEERERSQAHTTRHLKSSSENTDAWGPLSNEVKMGKADLTDAIEDRDG